MAPVVPALVSVTWVALVSPLVLPVLISLALAFTLIQGIK